MGLRALQLERASGGDGPRVTGFRGRALLIDGVAHDGAVIVTPASVDPWDGRDLAAAAVLDPPPEFVLYGSGATLARPDPAVVAELEARGIGVEAMDTRAAARAWTLLRGEGRWITAALLPLS